MLQYIFTQETETDYLSIIKYIPELSPKSNGMSTFLQARQTMQMSSSPWTEWWEECLTITALLYE